MQAGKVCATHPGTGAPLRMRKPVGRGSKGAPLAPFLRLPQRTTPGMQSASRALFCACALSASRCSLGLVVRGGWGCRRLTLVECAGRCGVAVLSRFTCLSLSLLPGFPGVVPCLPLPYIPRAVPCQSARRVLTVRVGPSRVVCTWRELLGLGGGEALAL